MQHSVQQTLLKLRLEPYLAHDTRSLVPSSWHATWCSATYSSWTFSSPCLRMYLNFIQDLFCFLFVCLFVCFVLCFCCCCFCCFWFCFLFVCLLLLLLLLLLLFFLFCFVLFFCKKDPSGSVRKISKNINYVWKKRFLLTVIKYQI